MDLRRLQLPEVGVNEHVQGVVDTACNHEKEIPDDQENVVAVFQRNQYLSEKVF
jgi:hypothetical protein